MVEYGTKRVNTLCFIIHQFCCLLLILCDLAIISIMFCSRDSYNNCAVWKFTELSDLTENGPIGSLRARFEVTKGPSSISTINVQFNCESTTLSGVDLELQESGYRVSLVKKKFVSGTERRSPSSQT